MRCILSLILLLLLIFKPAFSSAQSIAKQDAIADLNYLITQLEATHANPYLHITKEDFAKEIHNAKAIVNQTDSIKLTTFATLCMPLLSQLGDAHTYLSWFEEPLLSHILAADLFGTPVRMTALGRLIIQDTSMSQNGQEILEINGHDAVGLFKRALGHDAGTAGFNTFYTEKVLFPIYLQLSGIEAPFTLKTNKEVFSPAKDIDISSLMKRFNSTVAPYTFSILEGDIGYLAYNQCEDYEAFDLFLKQTFTTLHQKQIDKLIIDISNNTGGDSSLNDLLLSYITRKKYRQSSGRSWKVSEAMKAVINKPLYLKTFGKSFVNQYLKAQNGSFLNEDEYSLIKPKKRKPFFNGKTAFVIGPKTFSSANFLADAVKTYQLSTVIGESTGELTNDFGEQITLQMPNSQMTFTCSIAFDIGADGNADKIETVHPDITVTEDVLDFTKAWLRKQ